MNDEIRMSNDELPIGWAQSKIGNLCSLKNGRAFKPTEWTTSGLPIVRIQNLNNPKSSYNYFAGEPEPRYHLLGGELLFAWSGTPGTSFGAHVWRGGEAVLNQHIFRVDFDAENMDKRFFRYAINQKLDELIDVAHGGVGLRHVTKGTFEGTEIKVPPLAEQKRIADKLEAVLGRVDACRARLDRVPALLKRFRQSVLSAATSGKLTEEWREEDIERATVPLRDAIKEIRTGPFGTSLHKADYVFGGTPIVNPMHINGGKIFPSDRMTVDEPTLKRLADFKISTGDVIIGRRGEMGRCAVITKSEDGWLCGTGSMVLTPGKALDPEYLQIFLSSPATVHALEGESVGSTMVNLNQKILLGLEIFFPPRPEQQEIVRRVEALFAFADRIEARLATAQKTVERLTPATLAKAFRGELVPQDPTDEPASALLARLASQPVANPSRATRKTLK